MGTVYAAWVGGLTALLMLALIVGSIYVGICRILVWFDKPPQRDPNRWDEVAARLYAEQNPGKPPFASPTERNTP